MGSIKSRRNGGIVVVALAMLTLLAEGYDLLVYGLAVPEFLAEPSWHLTKPDAGYIGSLTLIGMSVGFLVAGPLTDRMGRRKLMMIGTAWFSAGSFWTAFVDSPQMLGAARVFTGIGLGGVIPCAIAVTIEFAPRGRRQLYNGLVLAGYSCGAIVASLTALWLLPNHTWRSLFELAFAFVILVPAMYFLLPESVNVLIQHGRLDEASTIAHRYGIDFDSELRQHLSHEASSKGVAARRGYGLLLSPRFRTAAILFTAATFFSQLLSYGLSTWLTQIMRTAGYPLGSALQITIVLQLGAVVGMVAGSVAADRLGSKQVAVPSLLLGSVALFTLSIKMPFGLLMVVTFFAGIGGIATIALLYGFIADFFPAPARGSAVGLAQGLGRFGAVLGPSVGGWIGGSSLGVEWNFYTFAVPPVVAAICLLLIPSSQPFDDARRDVTSVETARDST